MEILPLPPNTAITYPLAIYLLQRSKRIKREFERKEWWKKK
jgi:hypothetical protein